MRTAEPAIPAALTRRLAGVVPAHLTLDAPWAAIRTARETSKQAGRNYSPSLMLAWCLTRAMERHPGFRGCVQDNGQVSVQTDFELGLSVLSGEQIVTAVLPGANRLDWRGFAEAYAQAVAAARSGRQPEVRAPVVLTSVGSMGIEMATPIVVPPSMATLVVGQAHIRMSGDGGVVAPVDVVTLSLTFDHRVVNGVGAAAFLQEVGNQIAGFKLPG